MPTPVVALNRAVAVAEIRGAGDGLLLLDELADELASYHPWHAARGSMLHRLGRRAEAYARAADLARTKPTVQFLRKQSESITRGD